MASLFQPSTFTASPDAPVIDAPSRWVDDEEDLMLGCECANPALQIERWGHEVSHSIAIGA